ncbi:MAG: helicase-related protein, partial [Patescibacteria group bacterium]
GAEIGRIKLKYAAKGKNVPRVWGYEESQGTIVFKCTDTACEFHRGIPVYVIDEDIYENRPSVVIGTVDKFAMLPWRPESRAIFGLDLNGERVSSPPGLIIQDELHLISGPLGSMVGLYEALIEEMCTDRRQDIPILPKIISSTATIRRYAEQIKALYAREDVALFPPQGLDADDSFFARYARFEDGTLKPGRVYLGIHAPGLGSLQTAQVRTFTALLEAPVQMPLQERDPWWTLMIFFNSLRELGTTLSLFQSDIPDWEKVFRQRTGLDFHQVRGMSNLREIELTGRLSSDKVPAMIDELEVSCSQNETRPVDVCLASSIIEVGIDIDRLSLMAVVGQPKTTSQYIQVTGRVGRKWQDRPGLIVTLYSASKPRDRSHFEKFRSYHEQLYAQVEPTSVTPFCRAVLDRALHAVMVAYVRQVGTEATVSSPWPYPKDMIKTFQDVLLPRITAVDPEEADSFDRVFRQRADEWRRWERTRWTASKSNDDIPLLIEAGVYVNPEWRQFTWQTPTSMRNVDATCQPRITGLYLDDTQ